MDLCDSSWRVMSSACLAVCAEHANLQPQRTGSIGHRLTPIGTDAPAAVLGATEAGKGNEAADGLNHGNHRIHGAVTAGPPLSLRRSDSP